MASSRASPARPGRSAGGPSCRVCGEAIPAEKEARCARCDTPHHQDCWDYVGHCAIFACSSTRTQAVMGPTIVPSAQKPFMEIAADGHAIVEGKPLTPRRSREITDVDGTARDLGSRHTDLELDTALESGLQWLSLVVFFLGFALGFPKRRPPIWEIPMTLWPIALGIMAFRLGIDCRYILDNERRVLLYRRSVLGLAMHWKICRFDQIRKTAVLSHLHRTKHGEYYTFSVGLLLPSQDTIEVSRDTRERSIADGFCRNLAEHLGSRADTKAHEPPGMGLTLPAEAMADDRDLPDAWTGHLGTLSGPWTFWILVLVVANALLFLG